MCQKKLRQGLQLILMMKLKLILSPTKAASIARRANLQCNLLHPRDDVIIPASDVGIFEIGPTGLPAETLLLRLQRCFNCRKRLAGFDIYMCSEMAFCSVDCRSSHDEEKKKMKQNVLRNYPVVLNKMKNKGPNNY